MKSKKRVKSRNPNEQQWKQIFAIFDRCQLDAKITRQYDFEEEVTRRGASLILKTADYFDFNFLCKHYLNLCTFMEIYAKHLGLTLPDFVVINPPFGRTTFFIVWSSRKGCFSNDVS
jgi:hypothetical protein